MRKIRGFTMVELIMFIIITSLLASTVLLALNFTTQRSPTARQQMIATQTAKRCMEWFIGQRRLNGYSSISCPSTTVPAFCTSPSGYTLAVNITCTTINSDSNYQTIAVTVSGNGDASLSTLIAKY
jgi:type II secretory pathway pseudopilin PulG